MAQDLQVPAAGSLFDRASKTTAVQSLVRRLEDGGALPCAGVSNSAQPFLAAWLAQRFPGRTLVIVTDNLKSQETFQQDLSTWLQVEQQRGNSGLLFYPPWDVLPHEGRLPHADTISDRLDTLVALSANSKLKAQNSKLVVTSVTALLQKTFPSGFLHAHTRALARGDRSDPLDLVEWLEEQGYEPEAQVTQKGEIALRGGILDVLPLTSPWPVRLEFFGDELESLRQFDPLTQISREEITSVILPPGGELGILKRSADDTSAKSPPAMATLLDYLAADAILLLCEPEQLAVRAEEYEQQLPAGDPFFIAWEEFLAAAEQRGVIRLELTEGELALPLTPALSPGERENHGQSAGAPISVDFRNLDAFRPLATRAPEPQIAEAQRREFFAQLHRWLRQDYAVHVFCNNDGERQRFEEIWKELRSVEASSATDDASTPTIASGRARPRLPLRGGQARRRHRCGDFRALQGPASAPAQVAHAAATRSALDIDFADLEEGDLRGASAARHRALPGVEEPARWAAARRGGARSPAASRQRNVWSSNTRRAIPTSQPPKLYVPVTEAHLVSKYVGAGKARPPLNTLGGTRWAKAKEQAERAVRDVAAELLRIQAARESQAGHAFRAGHAVAARVRERVPLRGNARPDAAPSSRPRPTWNGPSRWTG